MKQYALLLVLLLAGCLPPGSDHPGPGPAPGPKHDAAIQKVFDDYRTGLKALFEEVSRKIKDGELQTEVEVNQYIHDQSMEIRKAAFMLLNQDVEKRISGDKWTPESAADYWHKQGESL